MESVELFEQEIHTIPPSGLQNLENIVGTLVAPSFYVTKWNREFVKRSLIFRVGFTSGSIDDSNALTDDAGNELTTEDGFVLNYI